MSSKVRRGDPLEVVGAQRLGEVARDALAIGTDQPVVPHTGMQAAAHMSLKGTVRIDAEVVV